MTYKTPTSAYQMTSADYENVKMAEFRPMVTQPSLNDMFCQVIDLGRTVDTELWTPSDVIAKLAEETGELARAVQIKNGKLPSKTQPDGEEIEECADVINCAIDAISQVNRDLSSEELLNRLITAMIKKNAKWASVMFKKDVV